MRIEVAARLRAADSGYEEIAPGKIPFWDAATPLAAGLRLSAIEVL
jgi:hypothetical protein